MTSPHTRFSNWIQKLPFISKWDAQSNVSYRKKINRYCGVSWGITSSMTEFGFKDLDIRWADYCRRTSVNYYQLQESYLLRRKFLVSFDRVPSTFLPILAGVSQDSVLGPDLYRLYIAAIQKLKVTVLFRFMTDKVIL